MTLSIGLYSAQFKNPITNLLARAQSAFRIEESSAGSRLEIWKSALKMISTRPVFGFGPDTFRLVFPGFQTLRYIKLGGRTTVADNAHDYPLQLGSTLGIPAVAIFLCLLIIYFLKSLPLLITGDIAKRPLYTGFVAGVCGYMIHLLFGVSVAGSTTFLWIFLGLIAAQMPNSVLAYKQIPPFRAVILGFLSIFVLGIAAVSTLPYFADIHFARACDLAQSGHFKAAINEDQLATRFYPHLDRYWCHLGTMYLNQSKLKKDKVLFNDAIRAFERAKRTSPLEVDNYIFLAHAYRYGARSEYGKSYKSIYYAKAIKELKMALKLKPHSSIALGLLGICYLEMGREERVLKTFKNMVNIDPKYPKAHFYLGYCHEKLGNVKKALRAYRTAMTLKPDYEEARKAYIRLRISI